MKFLLEFDVSGDGFTEQGNTGMISGHAISARLGEVCRRVDGHLMEAGERGAILDFETDQKIGSWRISE